MKSNSLKKLKMKPVKINIIIKSLKLFLGLNGNINTLNRCLNIYFDLEISLWIKIIPLYSILNKPQQAKILIVLYLFISKGRACNHIAHHKS